ncbi:MAG: hypothetical protein AAGA77_22705, partial [Bacteroidota bacterium]
LKNLNTIRIDDNLFLNAPNDVFNITGAIINENNLNLTVEYGGGCGDIYYDLISETHYLKTNPLQKNIRLAFDDKDNCEALLELNLSFDLKEIQLSGTGSIIINLDGWDEQIEYKY